MEPVESLVAELRALTPAQLDRVARLVHEISSATDQPDGRRTIPAQPPAIPGSIVEKALRNGWPAELFTHVIGRPEIDFDRQPQGYHERRRAL